MSINGRVTVVWLNHQLVVAVSRLRHCPRTPTSTCRQRRWNRLSSRDRCTTSVDDAPATQPTSGQRNLTKGRIAAADGRFSRIRQVAWVCTAI